MIQRTKAAMVLAAGRGERMRPLTDRVPKPLLCAGGKPLIVRHVEKLAEAGFERLVVNHAHLGNQIETALGRGESWGLEIVFSAEHEALETAGGIAQALPLIGEDTFAVVNSDVYSDYDYGNLLAIISRLARGPNHVAHLVLVDNPLHHAEGDFGLDQTMVSDAATGKLTFSGIAVYRREMFSAVPRGTRQALAPLIRREIAAGRVSGEHFTGQWFDIGTPERLAALDRLLTGDLS